MLAQDLDLVLVLAQDLGTSACASSFGVWFVLKVLGVGKNARRHGPPIPARGLTPPNKNRYGRVLAAKTSPKWRPTWAFKK